MSEQSANSDAQPRVARFWQDAVRHRWPLYALGAVIAVLTLAFIDAGEEPLHPIEHRIALPTGEGTRN